MADVYILAVVRADGAARYYENLANTEGFHVEMTRDTDGAGQILADRDRHVDVLVVDNGLGEVYDFIHLVRQKYPRLIIILVDEEADFGMPGQADEFTTEPFKNDDLVKRITRLMSDRQLETLRSDSLPAVRNIAKRLRTASGARGKQEAAVATCIEMGFEYAAYYHVETTAPLNMALRAQNGPSAIQSIAPKSASADDLMGWVAQSGQSRIAGPDDKPNHPLVARGRLGAVACVPVAFGGTSFGVIAACRDRPNSVTQDNVMMLELLGAQLATALSKES